MLPVQRLSDPRTNGAIRSGTPRPKDSPLWSLPELRITCAILLLFYLLQQGFFFVVGARVSGSLGWLIVALFEILQAGTAWFLMVWKRNVSGRELGLRSFTCRAVPLAVGLTLVILCFLFAYTNLIYQRSTRQGSESSAEPPPRTSILTPIFILEVVTKLVVAPLTEEFLFRGLLFNGFRRHQGPRRAALISGAVFALAHMRLLPYYFLGGVLLAALYDDTGSLWPPILMHSLWAAATVALDYI